MPPSEKPASPENPEASDASNQTLETIFKETAAAMDNNPEVNDAERALLVQLETRYQADRLKVTLDTRQEILEFQSEITPFLEDMTLAEEEWAALDETVAQAERREKIEDHFNSIEGVETVADLRELSVEQLIQLEDRHEGVLLYAFTDFVSEEAKIDLAAFEAFYKNPVAGQKLTVNFRGNPDAESRLGAGDIFPPAVRRVTVYAGGDESDKRTSERRVGLKGQNKDMNGFFDSQGYIPVYSNDVVLVGGVDIEFDRKYRKPAPEGQLGELDYEKYEREMGAADTAFLGELPDDARVDKYHSGESLSKKDLRKLDIQRNLPGRNIESVLKKAPGLYRFARDAREKYRGETGIDIPESIMFGVIQIESGFDIHIMNKQGSGAGGLFQFMPHTWTGFLKDNPWVYEKMQADPTWSKVDQLDWRFNPEIMMYAGYWLATQNMKTLHSRRSEVSLPEFRQSEFYKTGKVGIDDAWLLYLPHHDGIEGTMRLLKYQSLREQGTDARTAEKKWACWRFKNTNIPLKRGRPFTIRRRLSRTNIGNSSVRTPRVM